MYTTNLARDDKFYNGCSQEDHWSGLHGFHQPPPEIEGVAINNIYNISQQMICKIIWIALDKYSSAHHFSENKFEDVFTVRPDLLMDGRFKCLFF